MILVASPLGRHRSLVLSVCLFTVVVGLNWAVFDRFGSDMPDWDQWDAEGLNSIAPWFEHDHFVAHLFTPHNEHRVVLTKTQNLAVTLANGQWDSRVECFFNAALHGLIAVGFWLLGRRFLRARWRIGYYLVVCGLFAFPLAWQNLLGGFHSQQYWLNGLSLVAIVLLPFSASWRLAWWIGAAAAILVLGSMGSGCLAAGVVFGVVLWRCLWGQARFREVWPTVGLTLVLVAVGLATRVEVPYHEQLKAKSTHEFLLYLARSLEWPMQDQAWTGILLWLPFLLVTWRVLRRPSSAPRETQTLTALGGWVFVQLLATAYERGAGATYPASRYIDTLIFGAAVNALAASWLLSETGWRRWLTAPVAAAWLVPLVMGGHHLIRENLLYALPETERYYAGAQSHVLAYLATNDRQELTDPIPYPSAGSLMQRLAHPSMRALMPESVRPSLELKPASKIVSPFVHNWVTQKSLNTAPRAGLSPETPALSSRPTWGSFGLQGASTTGEWRSAPLSAPLHGWLKFETAGDIGRPGVALELHDAASQRLLSVVQPSKIPGHTWRSAYVRAPGEPFIVVARDNDPHAWIAFDAPVEMGKLSYWSWRVMKNGVLIAEIAAIVALVVALAALLDRKTTPAAAEPTLAARS